MAACIARRQALPDCTPSPGPTSESSSGVEYMICVYYIYIYYILYVLYYIYKMCMSTSSDD